MRAISMDGMVSTCLVLDIITIIDEKVKCFHLCKLLLGAGPICMVYYLGIVFKKFREVYNSHTNVDL